MVNLLRGIARVLLPPAIRTPIADRVYAGVAWSRNARHEVQVRAGNVARRGAAALRRRLPAVPREGNRPLTVRDTGKVMVAVGRMAFSFVPAVSTAVAVHVRGRAVAWIGRHKDLIRVPREHLTPADRRRLAVLTRALVVIDGRVERAFRGLLSEAAPRRADRTDGRPPEVAFVIGTLGPGGAERQATNTMVGLQAAYDVSVQALPVFLDVDWKRFFVPALEAATVPVHEIARDPYYVGLLARAPHPDAPRLARAIARWLPVELQDVAIYVREFLLRQPDVVHLWLDEVNIKGGVAAVLAGVPRIVVGLRSVSPPHFPLFQPYMLGGYRALFASRDLTILNNSETGARDYERWVGLPQGRITVLRNGFDFTHLASVDREAAARYRERAGIPADAFVMGGVMRLSEEKRPLLFLDVAERVLAERPDARFILVGDGLQRAEVMARIEHGPLKGRIHAPGHESQPYVTMCAMDVLLLSSVFEGLPNVLIEAQALGVPVITMPAGGAPETLDDGRTGWVVPDGTAEGAARIVAGLAANPARLRAAAALAPAFVSERFGYERMLRETATAYGGLRARQGAGRALTTS